VREAVKLAKGAVAAVAKQARTADHPAHSADALRQGAHAINRQAAGTMAEVRAHVEDTESPFHFEALMLVAERVLPMATINKAAMRLIARDEVQSRPQFAVNVRTTLGPGTEKK
jgi:hypothetical protein